MQLHHTSQHAWPVQKVQSAVHIRPQALARSSLQCRCDKSSKAVAKKLAANSHKKRTRQPPQLEEDEQLVPQEWRLFDWQAYQVPWNVPWSNATTATTMAVWTAGFTGTAFLIMPYLYTAVTHKPLWELTPAGQADFALWSEVAEVVLTFGILASVAARFNPGVKEQQLFSFNLSQPFQKGRGWLAWALLGIAGAPLVVGATAAALSAISYETVTSGGRGTADGVAGMISMDTVTYVKLLIVTGVLAPLLEETLFRGFLLTSLTRVMPNWAAVIASSTAFGIAHLSIKDLPILIALGCWLGVIYSRSRNLLTPIIVHGAWNSTVLTLLFWLSANGVDVQQLLKDGAF